MHFKIEIEMICLIRRSAVSRSECITTADGRDSIH